MRILFASHGPAESNSSYHVLGFAKGLAALGHEVRVGVRSFPEEHPLEWRDGYGLASLDAILRDGAAFKDSGIADVLHVWTPREPMRRFAEAYQNSWGARFLVIHFEDNEKAVFERYTGFTVEEAALLDRDWPEILIHPQRYQSFVASANGITMVHRCLRKALHPRGEALELAPVLDFDFFCPGKAEISLKKSLGLTNGTKVVAYNGNDHLAAAADIRVMYEAMDLLIKRGRDVMLVRTGHQFCASPECSDPYEGLQFRPGPRCQELGFVQRDQIPALMRLADVFIQPGGPDDFNSFRLPSKIPECLSMSRPLITGTGNIGPELAAEHCAVVIDAMTPVSIADAVESLLDSPDEAAALGNRAREFARRRFAAEAIIPALESYYQKIVIAS